MAHLYRDAGGDIDIALTGESLITRRLAVYGEDRFLALRDLLRRADLAFTNAEVLFHNYEDTPAYWAGTYMRADPRLIADLQWLGIGVVSCANNHAYDFGEAGIMTNIGYLDRAGMPHSGTGRHMAAASAPVYVETGRGRLALISATSTYSNALAVRAGEQRADFAGRPGANAIDFTTEWIVDPEAFAALQRISRELGWAEAVRRTAQNGFMRPLSDSDERVHFLDQVAAEISSARFVRGDGFGKRTFIDEADVERNLQQVREARRMADWVLFSMHHHESGHGAKDVADHIIDLAHRVIDAGADMFVGHGPHEDRGIEIYKGRPIFYSLGDFVMENDTVPLLPQRSYDTQDLPQRSTPADFYDARSARGTRGQQVNPANWESFVAAVSFRSGCLAGIELRPVDLGFGEPRWRQGRPLLAEGEVAGRVLARLRDYSAPYGTTIKVEGDRGTIAG
jgi:poly-gamma-glutamate synthesis protein (capsule biosynthesis protein)